MEMTDSRLTAEQAKRTIRAEVLARRRAAHAERALTAGHRVADRFLGVVPCRSGQVVAGYWPMGEEIDPRPLISNLATLGCVIALPVVIEKAQALVFRRWLAGMVLEPGFHGTMHPPASSPLVVPDIVVAPMVAFDCHGRRLGYGGGYYDRTLAALRSSHSVLAVGIAYAAQEVPVVPHDGHDQRMDWIVTEDAAREALI